MNCWWLLWLIFQLWRVWQCKCWTTWLRLLLFLQSCREFYRWVSEKHQLLPSCATQLLWRVIWRSLKIRLANCLIQSNSVQAHCVRYKLEKLIERSGGLHSLRRRGKAETCEKQIEVISADQVKYYLKGCHYCELKLSSFRGKAMVNFAELGTKFVESHLA